jgi:cytoskeletal protein CcmA (bactofilin family)
MTNPETAIESHGLRVFPDTLVRDQVTVLPKSATMKGDLIASKDMSIRLDGEFNGKIEMQVAGAVHIAAGAVVTTDSITADFIFVEGWVAGTLHARKAIELGATAKVKGSIQYDEVLDMHAGARIAGQINGPETNL